MAIVKIPVAVVNKIAMVDCGTVAVADNNNYVLDVTFDAEWAEYTTKTARFICGAWVSEKAFTGNTVEMPMLPPDYTHVRVGFYAGDISTTSPAKIAIVGSIMSNAPSEIEAAEIERVRAEAERAEAEAQRVANENDRITAEQERVDEELERQANELIRIANEQERIAHGTLFIAEYGVATYLDIVDAVAEEKAVMVRKLEQRGGRTVIAEGILRESSYFLNPNDVFIFDSYPYEFRVNFNNNWTTVSMLDYDPTENSGNLLTSGSVYRALQGITSAFWATYGVTTPEQILGAIAANKPVFCLYQRDVYCYAGMGSTIHTADLVFISRDSKGLRVDRSGNWSIYANADTMPTENSTRLITSGGVWNALSNYYTASETEQYVDSAIAGVTQFDYQVVTTLPATGVKGTIYLVPNGETGEDTADEYIWIDGTPTGRYELIGNTAVDLSDYYTKSEVDTALAGKQETLAFDTEPTENSTNPVTSGGVYTALQASAGAPLVVTFTRSGTSITFDSTFDTIRAAANANRLVLGLCVYGSGNTAYREWYRCVRSGRYVIDFTALNRESVQRGFRLSRNAISASAPVTVTDIGRKLITNSGVAANNTIDSTLILDYTINNAKQAVNKEYVDDQIATRQPTLTFDTTPTAGSANPVTSNGIYAALGTKVDKVTGKGLSTNDYTNTDKAKVDNMPTATSDLTNDSDFQNSTEVNDAIAAALGSMTSLQYEIVTTLPTMGVGGTVYLVANSYGSYDEYMWIGGRYYNIGSTDADLSNYYTRAEVDTRLDAKQDALIFDAAPTVLSTNPVTSDGIYNALQDKQAALTFDNTPTLNSANPVTSEGLYLALQGKQNTLTFDGVPTALSPNPVTSAGLYTALEGKQAALTFDEQPIVNSRNPVTSSGIYAALLEKENRLTYDLVPTRNSGNPVTSGGVWSAIQGSSPADIQQMINDAIAGITGFEYQVVSELPAAGEKGIIYLVPSPLHPDQTNEYVWIEGSPSGHFEAIGTTDIDLDNYYTKTETDDLIDEVRVFEAQLNVTSAADIIQAVNDRKIIVVHMGADTPSEFAVKAAISGADKVYLYTMTLNVGTDRSYPVFTRHVIEGTTWAVRNVGGAVTDDVPFIAEYGRTTPPQIEAATAKNRIIVVKTTGGAYYPCINVSTTADYHTRLHCLVGSYDAAATTFGLALKVYDIYGATWTEYSTAMVTAADLQDYYTKPEVDGIADTLRDEMDTLEADLQDEIALKNNKITTYEQNTVPTDSTKFSMLDGDNNQNNRRWTLAQLFSWLTGKMSVYTGDAAFTYTNVSSTFTGLSDYTGVTRQAWKFGKMAGLSFHMKCTASAGGSNWYYVGTVPATHRPKYRTAIPSMVYTSTEGQTACGGDIGTDGRVRLWLNHAVADNNTQFRVNITYLVD